MNKLSKYTDKELREELDRRTKKARNSKGYVRCKDCIKPEICKLSRGLKGGVWRICEDYIDNEITV